jgi:hypothetical protein
MIADTNDKRTHTFYRLTTSPRVRIGSPAAPSHKLRWNRDCLGLQSSKTGTIPPQLRWDSAAWRCWPCAGKRVPVWGLGMGCGFRYSHQPETATRFEPLFRDVLSAKGLNRKLQPTIRSKSGLQFPRARQRATAASPRLLPQQGLLGRDRQRADLVAGGVRHGRGHGGERRVDDDLADRLGTKRTRRLVARLKGHANAADI